MHRDFSHVAACLLSVDRLDEKRSVRLADLIRIIMGDRTTIEGVRTEQHDRLFYALSEWHLGSSDVAGHLLDSQAVRIVSSGVSRDWQTGISGIARGTSQF